jgi:hypothetical protein
MKSSLHRLIPFLPLFCKWKFRRLDSVQFFCSQAHNLVGWSLETRLLFHTAEHSFITTSHGPRRKHSLITDPLPSNGRPIAVRVGSHRNVFTESLPSNGSIRHTIYNTSERHCTYTYLHILLALFTLPWQQNWLSCSTPLWTAEYRTKIKSFRGVKPASRKQSLHVWAPSVHIVIFL